MINKFSIIHAFLVLSSSMNIVCSLKVQKNENFISNPLKNLLDEQSKIRRFVCRHTEELLPAILRYNHIAWCNESVEGTKDALAEVSFRAHIFLKQSYKNHVERMMQEKCCHGDNKDALEKFILSIVGLNNVGQKVYYDNCFNMDKMDIGHSPFPRFIQHPEYLLERKLHCNEVYYVLWSDGSIKIKMHEDDKHKLLCCTLKQLQFIKTLYKMKQSVQSNNKFRHLFVSLPSSMRGALIHNYKDFGFKSCDIDQA